MTKRREAASLFESTPAGAPRRRPLDPSTLGAHPRAAHPQAAHPDAAPPPPPAGAETYARVAVERSIDSRGPDTDDGLTYSGRGLARGDHVEVPLGRGDTAARGVVLQTGGPELLGGLDPRRVKAISRRTGARLPEPLLALAEWMAGYYICPLGMVFAAMLPAAVKHATGAARRTLLARAPEAPPTPAAPRLKPAAQRAWAALLALPDDAFPADPRALARLAGTTNAGPINQLLAAGLLAEVESETVRPRGEDALAAYAAGHPAAEQSPPRMTAEQQAAVDAVTADITPDPATSPPRFGVHLLFGVTGSGKTEVYLHAAHHAVATGRTALVLVPEIALTPQTAARFLARFGPGTVALLHSGMSASQRHAAWREAAEGRARVVVGARSAVFAPLENLGLIVVDEEHDGSYKQDQLPRYHARDVAIKRAQLERCPVLLGSATPSLETWAKAQPDARPEGASTRPAAGAPRLARLTARVAGGTMPTVRIVDIARERAADAERGLRGERALGPTLRDALTATLRDGGQAILLHNRRGYAAHVACASPACAWKFQCDRCSAAMVLHRGSAADRKRAPGGILRCHHCLAETLCPARCPRCDRPVRPQGEGTQRVEDQLAADFALTPGVDFQRVDSDTMTRAADLARTLGRFASGSLKLLLGTQMIAKGLDVANVRLVGVVNADTALTLPDFRAAERTFQLVNQVAGRAGRGAHPGLVIVQTLSPNDRAVRLAAAHDYETFAAESLTERTDLRLPPARRMARIVCRDADATKADHRAQTLAQTLREIADPDCEVLGPAPCVLARINERWRVAVDLLAPTAGVVRTMLNTLRRRGLLKADAATEVDVDPIDLL